MDSPFPHVDRRQTLFMKQMLALKARQRRIVEIAFILLQSLSMLYWTVTMATSVLRSSRNAGDRFDCLFAASLMSTGPWKKWDSRIQSVFVECHLFAPRLTSSWLSSVLRLRPSSWLRRIIASQSNVETKLKLYKFAIDRRYSFQSKRKVRHSNATACL